MVDGEVALSGMSDGEPFKGVSASPMSDGYEADGHVVFTEVTPVN